VHERHSGAPIEKANCMSALPLSAPSKLAARFNRNAVTEGPSALVPRTGRQLAAEEARIIARATFFLRATIALAILGVIAVSLLPLLPIPADYRFGVQEVLAVAVFAACLFLLHERTELTLRLFNFEPVEQTTQGEMRALLHHVPEGASFQNALAADNRTFVIVEVEEIRRRAELFKPWAEGADA
jgi:hypothetical protein